MVLLMFFCVIGEGTELSILNERQGDHFDTGDYIIPPDIARPVFYISNLMLLQVRTPRIRQYCFFNLSDWILSPGRIRTLCWSNRRDASGLGHRRGCTCPLVHFCKFLAIAKTARRNPC